MVDTFCGASAYQVSDVVESEPAEIDEGMIVLYVPR
jgi:hypothetical protein